MIDKELIEYQYKVLPEDIYEDWLRGYIKTLSPQEVKQLSSDMPAWTSVAYVSRETVAD